MNDLRIRMYNVGFGDCFLFTIPTANGPKLVLYDFGQHINGRARTLSDVCADLKAEAIKIHDKARIDVVIATHRHHDHIAGFDLKAMQEFEVGEVWLPWTENPSDPTAIDLQTAQLGLADRLQEQAKAQLGLQAVKSLHGFDFVENSASRQLAIDPDGFQLSNAGAMETLLHHFDGSPTRRFLPAKERSEASFETSILPGVKVHSLGPSHDPAIIGRLKPPEGEFFSWVPGDTPVNDSPTKTPIFGEDYRLDLSEHQQEAAHLHRHPKSNDFNELKARARNDGAMAATMLEDAVNGTSLVLVLEIGRQVLVLGGDAEWGTWEVILDDPAWVALLDRTTVYKVSHHGSYNGTPLRYVQDHMPKNAISMVSLATMKKWPSIPRASLMDALGEDDRTLVSSRDTGQVDGVVTAIGPSKKSKPLYVDVTVKI